MYKLFIILFILSLCCTRNNPVISMIPDEEEPIISIDTIPDIAHYDSIFFQKNTDYLFSAKIDTNIFDTSFTLEDQNIYQVIAQYQQVDTNYVLAMLLYKDNSSDIIFNDFPDTCHLIITTTSVKFSFPDRGIFRIKIE